MVQISPVTATEKHGVFKSSDGWRYRHYGQPHMEGQSAGPYSTRAAAMEALLHAVGFAVEGDQTSGHAQTPAGPREVLRSVCHAGGELGCSCADRNYQWFDHACREQIVSAFKKMLNVEAALADTSTVQPQPVAYQRRNIGPDGSPFSSWYLADDEPTKENMRFDGYLSYEYRPLFPGPSVTSPVQPQADWNYTPKPGQLSGPSTKD